MSASRQLGRAAVGRGNCWVTDPKVRDPSLQVTVWIPANQDSTGNN